VIHKVDETTVSNIKLLIEKRGGRRSVRVWHTFQKKMGNYFRQCGDVMDLFFPSCFQGEDKLGIKRAHITNRITRKCRVNKVKYLMKPGK